MKIHQAHITLEQLISGSARNSEKKVYKKLLGALNSLQERDLSAAELQSVEEAIDPSSPVGGGGTVGGTFLASMLDVDGLDLAFVNNNGRKLHKRTLGENRLVAYSGMPIEGSSRVFLDRGGVNASRRSP